MLHSLRRLTCQHYLLKDQHGWLLHPKIPFEQIVKENAGGKVWVADVGTGNGLVDTAFFDCLSNEQKRRKKKTVKRRKENDRRKSHIEHPIV